MSLEQQLETLNNNFVTLIGLLTSGEVPKAVGKKKAPVSEQVAQPADSPPADKQNSPVASSTAAQQPAASTAPAVTDKHITQAIIALCSKDKGKCLSILESFGAKRGGDLKTEQHGDAYKKLHAAVSAHPEALEKLNAALAKLT